MKKALLGLLITFMIALVLFGYFYDDSPSREIEQTIETN